MKYHNLAFIDVETTGLEPATHEIIELGAVIARQIPRPGTGADIEIIDELDLKIRPEHIETADPESLLINGYTAEKWKDALSLADAMKRFAEKTRGATFVAHNLLFDYAFVDAAFKKSGVKNLMHYHKLDTISIAFSKLYDKPDVEKFSLRFLCEYLGVENKNAHTALSDARATFEVYKKLLVLTP